MTGLFHYLLTFLILIPTYAFSLEKGKWTFTKDKDWCYIGSIPIEEQGEYTKRGQTYFLAYRINKDPDITVQVNAGYNYNEDKNVELIIDEKKYLLFSQGDSAWSEKEDNDIIYAMIKGKNMTIKGMSSRGTLTKDTYTLIGFTAAYNKLKKDC